MRHFGLIITVVGIGFISCLPGCGGAGSAGIGGTTGDGTTGGAPKPVNNATATIHVDVNTRQVTITPLSGAMSNKIFQGNRIGFNSSLLLDDPGDTGRKV